MRYMGSKDRHAKELLPIILAGRLPGQWYVEPFCGGCNLIDKVDGPRVAADSHPYLIHLLKAVVNQGWQPPPDVSEAEYAELRLHPERYDPPLVGLAGFCYSYSGKWFGGYARGGFQSNGQPRRHGDEAARNLLGQVQALQGVKFFCLDYRELHIPPESIIYCDSPYAATTGYKRTDKAFEFDHTSFWTWVRLKASTGHRVYVSEYSAPDDFEAVWSKRVNNTLTQATGSKQGTEKLFVWKGSV